MPKPINDDLLKVFSVSSAQDEKASALSFDETNPAGSTESYTLTGTNPNINEDVSFDTSVMNFASTDEEMAYRARVMQRQTVQREVSDSVSQIARKIKDSDRSEEKGLLSIITKASASGLVSETATFLKNETDSQFNRESGLVSRYGKQACDSVLKPITNGELKKTIDSLGNLETLSTDLKNVVNNILLSAHNAQMLSIEDKVCITDKIKTGFTNQFVQKVNNVRTEFKSLFAGDSAESFNLYETKIGKDKTVSIDFQKQMSLQGRPELTGLKLSADGTDFVQSMTNAGELKDVLSMTLKTGTQANAAAVSLGYAAGGSVYTPSEDGVLYVTTSKPIGKTTTLNVFAQGNEDSNAVMTTFKFSPTDKSCQKAITVGSTDKATAVDASFEYTDKEKEKSVKAYAGVVDETATAKVSFDRQLSETDKISMNSAYVNTFMLNAEYLSKQSEALHKLGVSLTGEQAVANYTYQNGKGIYAKLGVEYNDENEKKVDVSFKTGYAREW